LAKSAQPAHATQLAHPRGGGYPSSSLSYPSTAASAPWQTDQRSTPPLMPLLNSATPPPPHLVMTSFNDCHFLLHYSPTAASPHRLTTPIKGRCLHQFLPCHSLSFPPPPKLEHCRHRASPLPPLHHCLLATTPLPEPWRGPKWDPHAPLSIPAPANELPRHRVAGVPTPVSALPHSGTLLSMLPPVHCGPFDPAMVNHPWTQCTVFPIHK
jgi:hypothetical protein